MKKLFKKQNQELDFSHVSPILSSGAAVGIAIANHVGRDPRIGGTIGIGLSILVAGLLEASEVKTVTPILIND